MMAARYLLCFTCFCLAACTTTHSDEQSAVQSRYSVYYRPLTAKVSWVELAGRIVFDKTEVLLIDSSNTGYHFNDTAEAVGIAAIAERRLDLINAHPNIAWLRDYGFVKLIKKELPNNESYLVMSNDSNFIFVYKILADSADGGFSCELYGSHSRDSSQVFYSYHAKDNEIYSFKKFK
ncbi:MAG: hypothetical protein ACXVPQ_03295 [Bacteroidia bacterium]